MERLYYEGCLGQDCLLYAEGPCATAIANDFHCVKQYEKHLDFLDRMRCKNVNCVDSLIHNRQKNEKHHANGRESGHIHTSDGPEEYYDYNWSD